MRCYYKECLFSAGFFCSLSKHMENCQKVRPILDCVDYALEGIKVEQKKCPKDGTGAK